MNTAGFSAAVLTQKDAPGPSILQTQRQQQQQPHTLREIRTSSSSSSKITLAYLDLMPLLLGNFKTVAEAVAAVAPDRFRLVSSELVVKLENAIMGEKRTAPVLHYVIHDAEVRFHT
jgi:hypothetical protein